MFGPQKSEAWIVAFCISILESVFLSQPIKVSMMKECTCITAFKLSDRIPANMVKGVKEDNSILEL